jgi:hypothetical protein
VKQPAFDTYEYIGIITPGAVLLTVLMLLFPEMRSQIGGKEGIQLGGLGIFLILSFVLGNVVQSLGYVVVWLEKKLFDGNASEHLLNPACTIINRKQRADLKIALLGRLGADLDNLTPAEWRTTRTEMYGLVNAASKSERIDAFNRSYSLNKGLSAVFFVSGVLVLIIASQPSIWGVVLAAGSGLSFVRMRWFSECYTRELVLQFIRTCETASPKEQPSMQIRYENPAGQTLPAIRILPSF